MVVYYTYPWALALKTDPLILLLILDVNVSVVLSPHGELFIPYILFNKSACLHNGTFALRFFTCYRRGHRKIVRNLLKIITLHKIFMTSILHA